MNSPNILHARFAIALLVSLCAPPEAWALVGVTPSTESTTISNTGSPNFTQGATGCTSTSVSFNSSSFVTCNSGAWAVEPVQIGTAASAPYTCSSTYEGMEYFNTGTNAIQYCNGSSWTALATTVAGSSPVAFSFTNQTGVSTSSTISSNAVTLSGFTGTVTATCGTGCTAIAHNGAWGGTTVSGFQSGDTIAIQQASSSSTGTATTATVTAGSTTSGTWTATTATGAPSAFSFTNVTGATTGWTVESNAVTLSGFTGSLTAFCNSGCTGIAVAGVWGGTTATVTSGQTIAIAQTASSSQNTATTASVTVGSTTSGTWSVTTETDVCAGYDTTPGTVCPDGEIYAGVTTDTNVKMYTTPCDAGQYWNGSSCVVCSSGLWSGSGSTCSTTYSSGSTNYTTWNNGTTSYYTTGFTNTTTGKANTAGLAGLSSSDSPYKAAAYCYNLPAYSFSTWYLPSENELTILYNNRTAIGNFDTTAGAVGGAYPDYYWASTEGANVTAWVTVFAGSSGDTSKSSLTNLRCVRR
jgi:hypothetical protein